MAARYLKTEINDPSINAKLIFQKMTNDGSGTMKICEDQSLYKVKAAKKVLK